MSNVWAVVTTLAPSVGLGVIFYFVMRWVLRADRNERRHLSELDQQWDAARRQHDAQEAAAATDGAAGPSAPEQHAAR